MDLHDQSRLSAFLIDDVLDRNHREFDEIGGCALHRRVDRRALGTGPTGPIGRLDFRQPEPSAKDGLDKSIALGSRTGRLHVSRDTRITVKVAIDPGLGCIAPDSKILGQTECGHAINQSEIDHFGITTLLRSNTLRGGPEYFCGRCTVHVLTFVEGAQQGFIFAEMRHDPQFDLRIIGRDNRPSGRGNKRFTNASALGRADRNVLQIGV